MSDTIVRRRAARHRREQLEVRAVHETRHLVTSKVAVWLLRDVLRFAIDIPDFGRASPMSEECIIALTKLRAWQYRVWLLLGKPSGPYIIDNIAPEPLVRPSRAKTHRPDGTPVKSRPPILKNPLHWNTGRAYATAVMPHLCKMVSPVEWHAHELIRSFGTDYDMIGRQLDIPADVARQHCDRVRNLYEQWLSIPKFCTRLAQTRGASTTKPIHP